MSETVIKVEDISKAYRIGLKDMKSDTLGGAMVRWLKSPVKNYRNLRNLSSLDEDSQGEDVFWALRDISFEVKQGDLLGIIGKNGAGKSTLLKILSKITDPTKGNIQIKGRVASLLEVGTGFNPDLTGRENTYLNGTILGMTRKEIDRKFDEIVEFSGVEKFIDTPVKRYSSGMKVRLGFAVAAHLDPEILVVDEVLAVGDYEFQKKCLGKMQDVSRYQGRTVLFVSHNLTAIKQLCNTGLYLKNGTKQLYGPIGDILTAYKGENSAAAVEKSLEIETEKIKLFEVAVTAGDGGKSLDIAKEVVITAAFECKIVGVTMDLKLYIYSEEDILLFVAPAVFADDNNSEARMYTIKFVIPSYVLNASNYTASLIFTEALKYVALRAEKILNFNLEENVSGNERIRGKLPGVVRPNVKYIIN